jgi:hypothetical protein
VTVQSEIVALLDLRCGLLAIWIAAVSGGCFSVELAEDQIACGPGGSCPPGLACGADGFCGALAGDDAGMADATGVDAATPSDAAGDASVSIDAAADAAVPADAAILTFSFQDGVVPDPTYAGTRDSVIREASPTTNYGGQSTIVADGEAATDGNSHDERALVRWDLTAIPGGSTVESASITFLVVNASADTYPIYAVRRAWTEDGVTWQQASAAEPWTVAGADGAGDRDGTPIAEAAAAPLGTLTLELGPAALAVVQQWIADPASNHGFMIFDPDATDGLDLASREHGTPSERPRLDVTVTVP